MKDLLWFCLKGNGSCKSSSDVGRSLCHVRCPVLGVSVHSFALSLPHLSSGVNQRAEVFAPVWVVHSGGCRFPGSHYVPGVIPTPGEEHNAPLPHVLLWFTTFRSQWSWMRPLSLSEIDGFVQMETLPHTQGHTHSELYNILTLDPLADQPWCDTHAYVKYIVYIYRFHLFCNSAQQSVAALLWYIFHPRKAIPQQAQFISTSPNELVSP